MKNDDLKFLINVLQKGLVTYCQRKHISTYCMNIILFIIIEIIQDIDENFLIYSVTYKRYAICNILSIWLLIISKVI